MRNNYAAWELREDEFAQLHSEREKLAHLCAYGVLAPSTHNAQPWRFTIKENSISLCVVPERLVPHADPDGRLALVSIGAAIENIVIAGEHFGYHVSVSSSAEPDMNGEVPVATLQLVKTASAAPAGHALLGAIPQRRSNRMRYINTLPHSDVLANIGSIRSGDAGIVLVTDPELKARLADIITAFREHLFSDTRVRGELANLKRTNFTKQETGMPGFTMGFPDIASLFAPTVIRLINVIKLTKKKDLRLLKEHTPVIGIVSAGKTLASALDAGRVLERALLVAQSLGLATSLSALPTTDKTLCGIAGPERVPLMLFRLGTTDALPDHSPRIPAKKIITHS